MEFDRPASQVSSRQIAQLYVDEAL
jgi:hypothetical protein